MAEKIRIWGNWIIAAQTAETYTRCQKDWHLSAQLAPDWGPPFKTLSPIVMWCSGGLQEVSTMRHTRFLRDALLPDSCTPARCCFQVCIAAPWIYPEIDQRRWHFSPISHRTFNTENHSRSQTVHFNSSELTNFRKILLERLACFPCQKKTWQSHILRRYQIQV